MGDINIDLNNKQNFKHRFYDHLITLLGFKQLISTGGSGTPVATPTPVGGSGPVGGAGAFGAAGGQGTPTGSEASLAHSNE